MRICAFEDEGDVLRFHPRHAHVAGGKATVDRRDVTLSEAKEREELDRRAGVCHCDGHVIRIEYHLLTPCHRRRPLRPRGLPPSDELPATIPRFRKAISSLRPAVGVLTCADLRLGSQASSFRTRGASPLGSLESGHRVRDRVAPKARTSLWHPASRARPRKRKGTASHR